MFYTGIGSRETPAHILSMMERIARCMRGFNWTLRSGHAPGADRAFELGAYGKSYIYLPWQDFGQRSFRGDIGCPVLGRMVCCRNEWLLNATWAQREGIISENLPTAHLLLHGRNVAQITGSGFERPHKEKSKLVVCWCEIIKGKPQGGTATAIKTAEHFGIPVFNLFYPMHQILFEKTYMRKRA